MSSSIEQIERMTERIWRDLVDKGFRQQDHMDKENISGVMLQSYTKDNKKPHVWLVQRQS